MEIPVLAEGAGTVAEVLVNEGDVVQEGDVLVVLAAELEASARAASSPRAHVRRGSWVKVQAWPDDGAG